MAIAFNLLTSGSEDTDNTSFTTASVSPTSGAVVFIAVMNFENSTTQPAIGSISGAGLTWTVVREQDVDASGGDRSTVHLWKGLGTPSSGTITVTWAGGANIRRPSWSVFEATGADTTTPIVQHNGDTSPSSATTLTTTLASFADATNNACICIYGVQNNTDSAYVTPHTGHTELSEAWISYSHHAVSYLIGEDTSVGGGSWNSGRSGQIAVELAAGSTSLTVNFNVLSAPASLFNPSVVPGAVSFTTNVITASSTVLTPSVVPGTVTIQSNVITASSTLFNPSITVGAVTVQAQVLAAPSTLFNPLVVPPPQTVSLNVLTAVETLFAPSVAQDIALNVINTTLSVLEPSLTQNIELNLITATETVFTPATDTSVNVDLLLLSVASTLYGPDINQDIQLNVLNAPATVPNPSIPDNTQTLDSPVITVASTLYNPTVTTLNTVEANVISVPVTVNAPALTYSIEVPVLNASGTVLSPSLEYLIQMQTVNTAPTLHTPFVGEPPEPTGSGAIVKTHDPSPFPIGIR